MKFMKPTIISIAFTFLLAFTSKDKLTGRWETKPSVNGNVTGVLFKEDNTFEGYVNRKPFTSATYTYSSKDSILSFIDNGCNGTKAIYKLQFFSNSDSLRFEVINDSCAERKNGMLRTILGRVK